MIVPAMPHATSEPSAPVASALRLVLIATLAFLTVVDLFAAQALLPSLTAAYGVTPAAMSLAVNACTLGMAAGGLGVAILGHRVPRRQGIVASLLLLTLPTMLLSVAPDIGTFAALRMLQGLAMATAFALTLAHLGERFKGASAAGPFAAYITGNVASNLIGRLMAAAVADHAGLGSAFIAFSLLNLAGAALAYATVAPEMVEPRTAQAASATALVGQLRDARLRAGFGIGFLILFAFIGTFTFVNFALTRPPLSASMMQLGLAYLVFLPSIVTTPLAGAVGARLGTRPALWLSLGVAGAGLPLLVSAQLGFVLAGMVLVAAGTFGAQALATGYVARTAHESRSAASGLYLACYFIGGLVGTAVLGQVFDRLGWRATVAGVGGALAVAAALVGRLRAS